MNWIGHERELFEYKTHLIFRLYIAALLLFLTKSTFCLAMLTVHTISQKLILLILSTKSLTFKLSNKKRSVKSFPEPLCYSVMQI